MLWPGGLTEETVTDAAVRTAGKYATLSDLNAAREVVGSEGC